MFNNLKPFVPSGAHFERSKALFKRLGFTMNWENGGLCEFHCGDSAFLLQDHENVEMQQNFMLSIGVNDVDAFYEHLQTLDLAEDFPEVHYGPPEDRPWGIRELHFVDIAGVCWHFS